MRESTIYLFLSAYCIAMVCAIISGAKHTKPDETPHECLTVQTSEGKVLAIKNNRQPYCVSKVKTRLGKKLPKYKKKSD